MKWGLLRAENPAGELASVVFGSLWRAIKCVRLLANPTSAADIEEDIRKCQMFIGSFKQETAETEGCQFAEWQPWKQPISQIWKRAIWVMEEIMKMKETTLLHAQAVQHTFSGEERHPDELMSEILLIRLYAMTCTLARRS